MFRENTPCWRRPVTAPNIMSLVNPCRRHTRPAARRLSSTIHHGRLTITKFGKPLRLFVYILWVLISGKRKHNVMWSIMYYYPTHDRDYPTAMIILYNTKRVTRYRILELCVAFFHSHYCSTCRWHLWRPTSLKTDFFPVKNITDNGSRYFIFALD